MLNRTNNTSDNDAFLNKEESNKKEIKIKKG
jgi:hypothetical protein